MIQKKWIFTALFFYAGISVWILYFFPFTHASRVDPGVERIHNFVPLVSSWNYVHQAYLYGYRGYIFEAFINIGGNIILFVPGGGFLFYFFPKLRSSFAFALCAIGSLGIESLQFISGRGTFDVDDIILNALGGSIGFLGLKWLQLRICTIGKMRELKDKQ